MHFLKVELHVPSDPAAIEAIAEGLVGLNCYLLQAAEAQGIDVPPLYESGVRYRREAKGTEWWESITDILGVHGIGEGDCEDLSALRAAEYRYFDGIPARVRILRTRRGSFHAVVELPDGTIEDPSRILVEQEQDDLKRRAHARKG